MLELTAVSQQAQIYGVLSWMLRRFITTSNPRIGQVIRQWQVERGV